jgi:hypothetical protein
LEKTATRLNRADLGPEGDPGNLNYFEAVNDFMQARDKERNFFWDVFLVD